MPLGIANPPMALGPKTDFIMLRARPKPGLAQERLGPKRGLAWQIKDLALEPCG